MENWIIVHEGKLFDGSEIRVIKPDNSPDSLAIIERNQGEHYSRFFILDVCNVDKAVEKCKRFIRESMKNKVK